MFSFRSGLEKPPVNAEFSLQRIPSVRPECTRMHESNALAMYKTVKKLGVPDSRIILMMSEGFACNPRNIYPGRMYSNSDLDTAINVYGDDIEVDYRGYEVTPENFIRILTGRHDKSVPRSKRLLSDENSNVFLYMTGHGGEGFLKFQDSEIISSEELGDSVTQMAQRGRFKEMLTLFDTCHAESLCEHLPQSNIICMILKFTDKITPESDTSLMELFEFTNRTDIIRSHPQLHCSKNMEERVKSAKITDFFGNHFAMKLLHKEPEMTLKKNDAEKKSDNDGSGNGEGWVASASDEASSPSHEPPAEGKSVLAAAALFAAGVASTMYGSISPAA
eukprot:gene6274-24395_t